MMEFGKNMTELDYREIWFIDKLIGYIGQDKESEIYTKALNEQAELILNSFISPIAVDITEIEGDVSVSGKVIVLPQSNEWLAALDQGVPPQYFISMIYKTTKKAFEELKVG